MTIFFEKYQGNGNDFIIIDDRENNFADDQKIIKKLCDRHFGIGADGLMLVRKSEKADFTMMYYNSDGALSTMCGNGGRCIAAFAHSLGIATESMQFDAVDGLHRAFINGTEEKGSVYDVSLEMTNVNKIIKTDQYYFLDTGSPHHVVFVDNVLQIPVYQEGRKIRYSKLYTPEGTNVNFVQIKGEDIFVRTYERGVENETLSCGTGVTASAIATYLKTGKKPKSIETLGGRFEVLFEKNENNNGFVDIWLRGPAEKVFNGQIDIL